MISAIQKLVDPKGEARSCALFDTLFALHVIIVRDSGVARPAASIIA